VLVVPPARPVASLIHNWTWQEATRFSGFPFETKCLKTAEEFGLGVNHQHSVFELKRIPVRVKKMPKQMAGYLAPTRS
jgi:hypothetical protein